MQTVHSRLPVELKLREWAGAEQSDFHIGESLLKPAVRRMARTRLVEALTRCYAAGRCQLAPLATADHLPWKGFRLYIQALKRVATRFLKHGIVEAITSDMHSMRGHDKARIPLMCRAQPRYRSFQCVPEFAIPDDSCLLEDDAAKLCKFRELLSASSVWLSR